MNYDLKSALGWITVIAVVASVASYILSMVVSVAMVTTTVFGGQLHILYQEFAVWDLMLGVGVITNSLVIFTISLVIFAVSFAQAATANGGFVQGLRTLTKGSVPRSLPNWLSVMPLLSSAILLFTLILTLLQGLFGVSTGTLPISDPVILIPTLGLAPIAEEIGFRISVIGLVVAVLVAVKFGKIITGGTKPTVGNQLVTFFSAFLSPGYAKESVGLPSIRTRGFKGISIPEWIFLFLTSIVFGAYHVIGGGWGPGKFLTAALSGFALAFVYLAYGAFADILLHWFFDLNLTVFYYYNAFNGVFATFGDLATLGAIALGVWGIIVGIYWLTSWRKSMVRPTRLLIQSLVPWTFLFTLRSRFCAWISSLQRKV